MPSQLAPSTEASQDVPGWVKDAMTSGFRDERARPWQKPLQGIIDDSMDRKGADKLENSALVEMKSMAA